MKQKVLRIITWLASVGLITSALSLAYIVLFPVNVLDDWKLRIPKDNYTLGETVVIESLYTKNVDTGKDSQSFRYLECKNKNGVYVRYLINEAVADRSKSRSTGTGIVIVIPERIAEVELPTECFFSISIDYDVYPQRAEREYARSQSFILSVADEQTNDADGESPSVTQLETPAPIAETPSTDTSSQSARPMTPRQSQPAPVARPPVVAQPEPEQKGLITGLLDTTVDGLNGVVSGVRGIIGL